MNTILEDFIAKVEVAGSKPVSRSTPFFRGVLNSNRVSLTALHSAHPVLDPGVGAVAGLQ
jgi:hypothetical protein